MKQRLAANHADTKIVRAAVRVALLAAERGNRKAAQNLWDFAYTTARNAYQQAN
ncbi:TPA: hypothetical protein N2902_000172 [Vibrio parahaemolyticus]|uniref:hypothetical protein n=1 Tax=Vibrio TaxID=662 RepID=UPI000401DD0E|nr:MULTISPECIES: hypothetical protein [Vibrio]EJL6791893.1 hypothetical protein [Vibrio alginolyticus]EII3080928.1 hypothetical protein [Vibrio parahaemolyticus]ELB1136026.1 hypothetical protein [Vibrio parahaemolyticus]ELB7596794.1 hypothetical protein [Vibrio parahaemolyticus]MCG6465416.1 hypothetical protein [Vibrio parahaemolyticus]